MLYATDIWYSLSFMLQLLCIQGLKIYKFRSFSQAIIVLIFVVEFFNIMTVFRKKNILVAEPKEKNIKVREDILTTPHKGTN